ncbi:hypothetical protein L4C36_18775 [Photobacterium japonica]|uniref:hypothetical protein n=1 Tax=Photobacterium japonica TaxID=2910235 RepID=UPI003D149C27
MAWEKGTASGYRDLLEKLKIFASANGWMVERWVKDAVDPTQPAYGVDELIMSSTGESGLEKIYVGFKTQFNASTDIYNLVMYASPLFSVGSPLEEQPSKSPTHVMYLWQNNIEYVFCLDNDHIKIAAQVSTTTRAAYLGKLRAYCSLGHWSRQVVCFGEGDSLTGRWSSQGDSYGLFQRFLKNPGAVLLPNGQWLTSGFKTYPSQFNGQLFTHGANYASGDRWLLPLSLSSVSSGMLGDFIGCHYICGDRTATWQQIANADATREWMIIQNIFRNGFNDFMAWELL